MRRALLAVLILWPALAQSPRVANFGEVDAGVMYRGAQPSRAGLLDLKKAGIRTVVDLRGYRARGERRAVEALGMRFVGFPLSGLRAPTGAEIDQVMEILDAAPKPVFVHCWHGEDRTGTVIACWRIRRDGWTRARALSEASAFHMSPFQVGMRRFIARLNGDGSH